MKELAYAIERWNPFAFNDAESSIDLIIAKGIRESDGRTLENVLRDYRQVLDKAKYLKPTPPFIKDIEYKCKVIEQVSKVVEQATYKYYINEIKEILSSEEKIKTSANNGSLFQYFSSSLAIAIKESNEEKIKELEDVFGDMICEDEKADEIIDHLCMILVGFINALYV